MHTFITDLGTLQETAHQISTIIKNNNIIAFYGNMGAGKTTLIKALCNELGVINNVTSPTFSLVNEYFTKNNESVYHFDFYRINNLSEIYDFGYEEYFYSGNKCLIEWPELIKDLLPEDALNITIKVLDDNKREVSIDNI